MAGEEDRGSGFGGPAAGGGTIVPTGTTTVIGPSIIIKGKLRSAEDLVVKGRIEAAITSTKALIIENSGIVKANVEVKSIRISGILVGNIVAEERVEIASDGRVVGDIYAPRILISDGAAFKGKIDMESTSHHGVRGTAPATAPQPPRSTISPPPPPQPAHVAPVAQSGIVRRDEDGNPIDDGDPTELAWKKLQENVRPQ